MISPTSPGQRWRCLQRLWIAFFGCASLLSAVSQTLPPDALTVNAAEESSSPSEKRLLTLETLDPGQTNISYSVFFDKPEKTQPPVQTNELAGVNGINEALRYAP